MLLPCVEKPFLLICIQPPELLVWILVQELNITKYFFWSESILNVYKAPIKEVGVKSLWGIEKVRSVSFERNVKVKHLLPSGGAHDRDFLEAKNSMPAATCPGIWRSFQQISSTTLSPESQEKHIHHWMCVVFSLYFTCVYWFHFDWYRIHRDHNTNQQ